MHPDLLLNHLDRAERHIVSGRKKILEQIGFIAWLAWLRKDATGAKACFESLSGDLRHTSLIESDSARNSPA